MQSLYSQEEICTAVKFKQPIFHEGCESIVVENSYCLGSCKSITIPSTDKKMKLNPFTFSHYCYAEEIQKERFNMKCNSRKKKFKIKEIEIVKSCKCKVKNL